MNPHVERITGIRRAVEIFLDLTGEKRSVEESPLASALDGLAWAIREIPSDISPNFSSVDFNASFKHDSNSADFVSAYRLDRKRIAEIFPGLGLYSLAEPTEPGSANFEMVVRDAIDDIVDIRRELESVICTWEEVGEAEALWEMRFGFESHWESHLRGLQVYLFHRLSPFYEAGW